jgi:hypothetical protein
MAEVPAEGKRPHYKPSQLKNQINVESIDDERTPEVDSVQAPDSQIVIPETQFDQDQEAGHVLDNESDHGDVILSPMSAAVLDRNAVRKNSETVDTPFAVTLFTKDRISRESSPFSAASVGFSFGQPKRAAISAQLQTMPSGVVVTTPQLTVKSSVVISDVTRESHQAARCECPLSCIISC